MTGVKTGKQYFKLFPISYHYQTVLTFLESYWQTILHFSEFISSNTDIFRELKQYWLIQSSHQTVFTLSQIYYQTIVNTFLGVWMGTWADSSQTENSQIKVRNVSKHTWTDNFAIKYACVYMIGHWWLYGRKWPSQTPTQKMLGPLRTEGPQEIWNFLRP